MLMSSQFAVSHHYSNVDACASAVSMHEAIHLVSGMDYRVDSRFLSLHRFTHFMRLYYIILLVKRTLCL